MGIGSLLAHKLRTLLTMLGMIFGVGAVVAMLSITEGARQEMIRYIDLLGVNNIVVEANEAPDRDTLISGARESRPGSHFRDATGHRSEHTEHSAHLYRAEVLPAKQPAPASHGRRPSQVDRRPSKLHRDLQHVADRGPVLHRGRARPLGAGLRARASGPRSAFWATVRGGGQVRQGQRSLDARHRGRWLPTATTETQVEGLEADDRSNVILAHR